MNARFFRWAGRWKWTLTTVTGSAAILAITAGRGEWLGFGAACAFAAYFVFTAARLLRRR